MPLFEAPPGVFRVMLKHGLILKLRNGREIYSLAFTTADFQLTDPVVTTKVKDILVTSPQGGSGWLMADEDDPPIQIPLDNIAGWQWIPAKPAEPLIKES